MFIVLYIEFIASISCWLQNEDKKTKFGYAYSFAQDGFGPSELAYINTSTSSRECGSLCRNIKYTNLEKLLCDPYHV